MAGKARANNGQRFQHGHSDGTGDPAALAGSLLAHRILWPWLGIGHIDEATVGEWMLSSLDRTHFFIPAGHPRVRDALAVYVRGTAGSVFHRFSATGGMRAHRRATNHQATPGLWAGAGRTPPPTRTTPGSCSWRGPGRGDPARLGQGG